MWHGYGVFDPLSKLNKLQVTVTVSITISTGAKIIYWNDQQIQ